MLPKNLFSSWARYKHDTDAIASWLATTAHRRGYVSETKSKSAKKRKNKAKSGESSQPQPGQQRNYTIPMKDFTTLAEFLVEQDPPVQVPRNLRALLDRTITARRFFIAQVGPYMEHEDDESKLEWDDKHTFFLRKLEQVRDILKPRFSTDYAPTPAKAESIDQVGNLFDNLQLEDTSEAFDNAPDVVVTPSAPVNTYKAEREEEDLMECYSAFQFLLHDLHKIRAEIQRAWEGYKRGMLDLVAVSITTNTAIDLARAMEEDGKDLFAKQGGCFRMLQVICASHNINRHGSHPPGDDMNFREYKTADMLFWPAAAMLEAIVDLVNHCPKGRIPEMKKGFFGTYNPSANRSRMSDKQKFMEDKILLMELVSEFVIHCRLYRQPHPAEDEFTRGMRTMFETKKISLSVILSATVFLDIHHILRDQVDYSFKALADTVDFVRNNVTYNFDFHKDLQQSTWPKQNDEVMRALLLDMKDFVQDDPYRKFGISVKRMNVPDPHLFMRQHPWLCGLWRYHFLIRYHEISIVFTGAYGGIISSAQLYNAVQQEKLIQGAWPDMDFVFATQGRRNLFVGEPPKGADEYLKRFLTIFGLTASHQAATRANRKKKGLVLSKRGPTGLKELGPVLQMFKDRYCAANPRRELRPEDVDKIFEQSNFSIETEEDGRPAIIERDMDDLPKKRKGSDTPQLSIPNLLATLQTLLHAELPDIAYDYLALHRNCWRLLRTLRDNCRDDLIKFYGPSYLEKEEQLPFIVAWIFMTASKTKELGNLLARETGSRQDAMSTEVTSKVLTTAADTLQGMLETGMGSMVIDQRMPKLGIEIAFEADSDDE